ncbi:MAG: nitronate monooxygenase [Chloroflexi bacterium]|nr:nitronate monooxygenase [Chloroflexota bacterium]
MFQTRITEMFGIQYPIVQGAMHRLSHAELAAAVSNAGGLGTVVTANLPSIAALRDELRKAKSLTDKPFCVNVSLFPGESPWNMDEIIEAVVAEGVKVIATSGRNPEPYIKLLKSSGARIIHKVPSARHAQTVEKLGYDAVSVVGFECGGHPGLDDVTSLVLVPRTVDSVKIPVIAGGGFGDGRGLVAALALGAEGVLMGTRFMATTECVLHSNVKQFMLQAKETDTAVVARSVRGNIRALKTDYVLKLLEMEARGATAEEVRAMIDSRRGSKVSLEGDLNAGVWPCGQVVGMVDRILPVKEVIDSIISQAQGIMKRLGTQMTH